MQPTTYHYLILGAGRQGTAAAYDLGRFGDAHRITLADVHLEVAQQAAERINRLLGRDLAVGIALDVRDSAALREAMQDADAALSAVPYFFNLEITRAAIETHTHLCDMGGNTEVVFQQLDLDEAARAAGVSIVPDCGMGPGLINTVGAYLIQQFDEAHAIRIYDGGLPQHPTPPWNYAATFHINGLTNEYDGTTVFLRDGDMVEVEGLTEHEVLHIEPLGELEAFVTTGGVSTAPYTFRDRVKTYQNKTLRYPGHYEWFRAYKALGLFGLEPIRVGDQEVVPREVFHALLEPKIRVPDVKDVCIIHVVGEGIRDGQPTTLTFDLVDYFDEETGFRAMERLTGWHCAIMLNFQAHGEVPPGTHPQEVAIDPARVLDEVRRRGIAFRVTEA